MQTIMMDMTGGLDMRQMELAGRIIREGGLVAFPTETVYGLGGNALDPEASRKIYAAKGRPSDNPLIVHIADTEALYRIVKKVPESAEKLAGAFWPGPLTLILPKSEAVPRETTGALSTVAVRMPAHPAALELIRHGGGYIAAPSANLSGRPSPTTAAHVMEDLGGRIEAVIDSGPVTIGIESTIVDLTEEVPTILRPGYINEAMLQRALAGPVRADRALGGDPSAPPKAPGMKYRHYAPKAQLVIVEGAKEAVAAYISRQAAEAAARGEKTGVIASQESAAGYYAGEVRVAGSRSEEITIAAHLYAILREFDLLGVSRIYSEAFDTPRMGQAIMNRLIKAAGHQIHRV